MNKKFHSWVVLLAFGDFVYFQWKQREYSPNNWSSEFKIYAGVLFFIEFDG